jgi:hypothetical protein
MPTSHERLQTLRSLVKGFERESGDVVIGKMIPELQLSLSSWARSSIRPSGR